jgi:tetratricopeptide (TPR) repeat protein
VDATHEFHQYASEPMSDLLAEIYGTRGIVSMEINQPESALEHIQIHMDHRLKSFHETNQVNSKLAAGYTELGRALTLNGLFTKAKEAFTKSIELRRQMPNFTRIRLFTPLKGLSLVAWHRGDNEQAAQLLLEALRDRELAFGQNDREGNRYEVL